MSFNHRWSFLILHYSETQAFRSRFTIVPSSPGMYEMDTLGYRYPLIHPGKRGCNDFDLHGAGSVAIITGSNMPERVSSSERWESTLYFSRGPIPRIAIKAEYAYTIQYQEPVDIMKRQEQKADQQQRPPFKGNVKEKRISDQADPKHP